MAAWWNTIDWQGPWQGIAMVGAVLLVFAVIALLADRRRHRRRDLDRVGCMPWTMIYVLSFFVACILLGSALRTGLGGG